MKDATPIRSMVTLATIAASLTFLLLAFPFRASAALGGDESSIQADQNQMKAAKKTVSTTSNYSVHQLQSEGGATVKEFVSPQGRVFGVTWQGPVMPNLQQLLGDYYAQFQQAAAAGRAARRRGPVVIQQPGLVVESGGHMRAYTGRAYVPGMLPEGVQAKEIR